LQYKNEIRDNFHKASQKARKICFVYVQKILSTAFLETSIMQNSKITIVFLTGLGADHRLFKHQTAAFPDSVALDWIEPNPGEVLEDYAVRLADTLLELQKPIIVCGLSLGGMIVIHRVRVNI
jgi:pimeloyl-ACP methyl ester carboxylesterase